VRLSSDVDWTSVPSMKEVLFLLLPLAAMSGWFIGRRSVGKDNAERGDRQQNPAYFLGLNLLLNEQPDKAIEVFIQLLEVDSETVETHLALGNLFRRRGEVDRAIRIHQNLIARPSLSKQQRSLALLELGQDYMKAGLYDRAEGLFNELIGLRSNQLAALRNLHKIYQRERDWEKCLLTLTRMESLGEQGLDLQRGHYYCEQGLQARANHQEAQADSLFKKALSADKQNVRASILLGEGAMARGDLDGALVHFSRVGMQNPAFFGEVVRPLIDVCRKSGKGALLREILTHDVEKYGHVEPMVALADMIQHEQGDQAATNFISHYLEKHPNLKGLSHLLALRLRNASGETEQLMLLLRNVITEMLEQGYPYLCHQCGFQARHLHWQCPGCKGWGTVSPQQPDDCVAGRGASTTVDGVLL
jgi:lipopolysaccharide biosynthesis regulator YciM